MSFKKTVSRGFKLSLTLGLLTLVMACGAKRNSSASKSTSTFSDFDASQSESQQSQTPQAMQADLSITEANLKAEFLTADTLRVQFSLPTEAGVMRFNANVGVNGNVTMQPDPKNPADLLVANMASVDPGMATLIILVSNKASQDLNHGRAYAFKREGQSANYSLKWSDDGLTRGQAVNEDTFRKDMSPAEAKTKALNNDSVSAEVPVTESPDAKK
jgi:hypothetical protein